MDEVSIGEFFFNPGHELYQSYYTRGFAPPADTVVGGEVIPGNVSIAEAIRLSISKTPVEIQSSLVRRIILSGGAFNWKVPDGMEGVAVSSPEKIRIQLRELGIDSQPSMISDPQFSVWRGSIIYGNYVPEDLTWDWSSLEGWMYL
jgi:Actin.